MKKKFISLLAAAMVLAMSTTAFAATSPTTSTSKPDTSTTTTTPAPAPVTVAPTEVKATVSTAVETKAPEEYVAAIAGTAATVNGVAVTPTIAPVSAEMVEATKAQLVEKLKDVTALSAAIGTSTFADAMKDTTKAVVPEIKTVVDVTAPAGVTVSEKTPITLTFAVAGIDEYSSVFFLHYNTTTGVWETIKGSCGNGFVTGTFTSLSPIAIVQMSADTEAVEVVDANKVTSPKTASELPVFPVIAVICVAGIAICAKKVKFN